jgi:hypothetical protein
MDEEATKYNNRTQLSNINKTDGVLKLQDHKTFVRRKNLKILDQPKKRHHMDLRSEKSTRDEIYNNTKKEI